jgi:NAD(P)H-dependent FMN reductase
MMNKKNIVAICGSTKVKSVNLSLIKTIQAMTADRFEINIFTGIDTVPHFNPDLDTETPPEEVVKFRELLKNSDGVLISTPEYAMGIPGSLKNAIDWTVSSCEFSHKPVALITASSVGQKGHAALLEVLRIIESKMTNDTQLLISFVKTKISPGGKITDAQTESDIHTLLSAFEKLMNEV